MLRSLLLPWSYLKMLAMGWGAEGTRLEPSLSWKILTNLVARASQESWVPTENELLFVSFAPILVVGCPEELLVLYSSFEASGFC